MNINKQQNNASAGMKSRQIIEIYSVWKYTTPARKKQYSLTQQRATVREQSEGGNACIELASLGLDKVNAGAYIEFNL